MAAYDITAAWVAAYDITAAWVAAYDITAAWVAAYDITAAWVAAYDITAAWVAAYDITAVWVAAYDIRSHDAHVVCRHPHRDDMSYAATLGSSRRILAKDRARRSGADVSPSSRCWPARVTTRSGLRAEPGPR